MDFSCKNDASDKLATKSKNSAQSWDEAGIFSESLPMANLWQVLLGHLAKMKSLINAVEKQELLYQAGMGQASVLQVCPCLSHGRCFWIYLAKMTPLINLLQNPKIPRRTGMGQAPFLKACPWQSYGRCPWVHLAKMVPLINLVKN